MAGKKKTDKAAALAEYTEAIKALAEAEHTWAPARKRFEDALAALNKATLGLA